MSKIKNGYLITHNSHIEILSNNLRQMLASSKKRAKRANDYSELERLA